MAARVTPEEVREIYDTNANLVPFIRVSHLIVEKNLLSCGLDEETLKEIELWLSAHFASVASSDERGDITSEKEGDLSRNYGTVFGEGLKASRYGQQVLLLDTCNILAFLGKTRAQFKVL